MEFGSPYLLVLAVLVLPLAFALRGRRSGVHVVPSAAALVVGRPTLRLRFAHWLPALRALALLLLVVGLARPRAGRAEALVPAKGIDIALSLDVSSSMETNSLGGGRSRLDVTREVVRNFIKERHNDRIGLVVFQNEALPISPLTLDYSALDRIVADLHSGILPDGTGIGVGLASALTMLQESPAATRIVILLTDGEHNARSISPDDAAAIAASLQVRVYTIGMEGERSLSGPGFDEELLRRMADTTGGRYFAASNRDQLAAIYDEIGRLETSRLPGDRYERFREFGPWFALAGAGLLLAEFALRGTWLRRATG